TSGRSFTMKSAPCRSAASRKASDHRRRSPASACFSRSCTTSTPAPRIASRNAGRSCLAPVTTYNRARASRSRLSTGDGADQPETIAVLEGRGLVPRALERLPVVLHHDEPRVELAGSDELIHGGPGIDLVYRPVGRHTHPRITWVG